MRSVTSFFNFPLLRDQLRRIAPLWLIYALLWLFALPVQTFAEASQRAADAAATANSVMHSCVTGGLYLSFFFGLLFAMLSFSFLTNARATGAYHALPVRREGIFTAVYLAGLLAQLASIALAVASAALITCAYGCGSYLDLPGMFLVPALESVFFYSFAVLCMVMTGQLLAAPIFYVIGNVLILGLEVLVKAFAGNFLFGYDSDGPRLIFTSPLFFLDRMVHVHPRFSDDPAGSQLVGYAVENLGTAAFYALLGLACAAAALLLYRSRRSEMTGSTVAIPWAVPVFKYGVAFCTALAFGQGSYFLLFGQYQESGDYSLPGTIGCMVVSGLLGYYIAEVLVKKSLRPDKRSLRGAGTVALVLVLLGITLTFDLTGYEGRVPAVAEIETASFSFSGQTNVDTGDPKTLRLLTAAHRAIVENRDEQLARIDEYYSDEDGRVFRVYIDYHTTSGATIRRSYRLALLRDELSDPESLTSRVNALYLCREAAMSRVFGYHSGSLSPESEMLSGQLTSYVSGKDGTGITTADLTAAQAQSICDALLADAENAAASGADIFTLQEYAATSSVSYSVELAYDSGDRSGGSMHIHSLYADISDATPCALAAVEELLPTLSPDAISATEGSQEMETSINLDPNSYESSSTVVWGDRHG